MVSYQSECLHSVRRLLLTVNVSSSPIIVTLMMQATHSSETSVLTRATRRNIPEDRILYSHLCENLRPYTEDMFAISMSRLAYSSALVVFEFAVPPDILDYPTSTDMVVREGTNVTLRCAATGSPQPTVTWRREGGEGIPLGSGQEGRRSTCALATQ
jgi:hypothetical protein